MNRMSRSLAALWAAYDREKPRRDRWQLGRILKTELPSSTGMRPLGDWRVSAITADNDRFALKQSVRWVNGSSQDSQIGDRVWRVSQDKRYCDAKNYKGYEDGGQEIAAGGLCKLQFGHWHKDSKPTLYTGTFFHSIPLVTDWGFPVTEEKARVSG